SYARVVASDGHDAASNVTLSDTVPVSLSVDAVPDAGGDSPAGSRTSVSCTLASLANGAIWTVTVDVTVDPGHLGGTISNTASAFADETDPDGSNNSSTQDTTVTPPPPPSADVSVTKTDSADPVDPGDGYSYDLVVTNNGPDAASNVALSDAVPASLSVDTIHDGGGDCSTSVGNSVSCSLGSLANGATWTVTVDVTVDPAHPGGTISNTASASSDTSDPDSSNNADAQDTTVNAPPPPSADYFVTKTYSAHPVDPGVSY